MEDILIRAIGPQDNVNVAGIIRTVMPEYGVAGEGSAIHDREVDDLFAAYSQPNCAYFICSMDGTVVGGGGIGPLQGGDGSTCELRKMYLLPVARGKGLGRQMLQICLKAAVEKGYRYCYLETFNTMKEAMRLYRRNGFIRIPGPLGSTGHHACDTFYQIDLSTLDVAGFV